MDTPEQRREIARGFGGGRLPHPPVRPLSELATFSNRSPLVLIVLDLWVEASTAPAFKELRDDYGRAAVRKQKKSDSIKEGMRYAREQAEVMP